MARTFFGPNATLCQFIAVYLIPLSLSVTVMFTQPIFAAVFCYIFLSEKLKTLQWMSIFFAMLGVVIMTNPQWVFFWSDV